MATAASNPTGAVMEAARRVREQIQQLEEALSEETLAWMEESERLRHFREQVCLALQAFEAELAGVREAESAEEDLAPVEGDGGENGGTRTVLTAPLVYGFPAEEATQRFRAVRTRLTKTTLTGLDGKN